MTVRGLAELDGMHCATFEFEADSLLHVAVYRLKAVGANLVLEPFSTAAQTTFNALPELLSAADDHRAA